MNVSAKVALGVLFGSVTTLFMVRLFGFGTCYANIRTNEPNVLRLDCGEGIPRFTKFLLGV